MLGEDPAHRLAALVVLGVSIGLGGPGRDREQGIRLPDLAVQVGAARPRSLLDDAARFGPGLGAFLEGIARCHPDLEYEFHRPVLRMACEAAGSMAGHVPAGIAIHVPGPWPHETALEAGGICR